MRIRPRLSAVILLTLAGCGRMLPPEAQDAVLDRYDPYIDQAHIVAARRVEPLPVDTVAGAEEVWCVDITVRCISPYYWTQGQYTTCGDNRLARLIDGVWQIALVTSDEDKANWEARGCEIMPVRADPPSELSPW